MHLPLKYTCRASRKSKEEEAADLEELRRKVVRSMQGSTLGTHDPFVPCFSRVPNEFELELQSVTVPFKAICTITKEPFSGVAYIVLKPDEWCMEYISLEDWIKGMDHSVCTHEELTRYIYEGIRLTLEMRDDPKALLVVLFVQESVHVPAFAAVGNLFFWAFRPKGVRDVVA